MQVGSITATLVEFVSSGEEATQWTWVLSVAGIGVVTGMGGCRGRSRGPWSLLGTSCPHPGIVWSLPPTRLPAPPAPEELVEVPVLHVLEDHYERVALHADAIELDNVLVLEVGQQLGLAVEVLACIVAGILQRLRTRGRAEKPTQLT